MKEPVQLPQSEIQLQQRCAELERKLEVSEYERRVLRTTCDAHIVVIEDGIELEKDNARLEDALVEVYALDMWESPADKTHYLTIAILCDDYLDRSGALLGRVRDRAHALLISRRDNKEQK